VPFPIVNGSQLAVKARWSIIRMTRKPSHLQLSYFFIQDVESPTSENYFIISTNTNKEKSAEKRSEV
jgi:hypothetical protein